MIALVADNMWVHKQGLLRLISAGDRSAKEFRATVREDLALRDLRRRTRARTCELHSTAKRRSCTDTKQVVTYLRLYAEMKRALDWK